MVDTASGDQGKPTLAEKLQRLRAVKPSEKPGRLVSYGAMAREINKAGVDITDTHIRNIFSGKQKNPQKHHLEALARYFGVPAGTLLDDYDDFSSIDRQLKLLESLSGPDVQALEVLGQAAQSAELRELVLEAAGLSPASLNILTDMARHLHGLERPGGRKTDDR